VALAGYNASFVPAAKLYRNVGNGLFSDTLESLAPVIDAALAWGDYDNDGDLDLILAGYNGTTNITRLYRNNAVQGNLAPFAPAPAGASIIGKTVTVYWYDSGDPNQSGGLTFNLRVGTNAGAGSIVSPMASATGYRRVPRLGNMGERTSWSLNLR